MTKRPRDDLERIQGFLERHPTCSYVEPFATAFLPDASYKHLRAACERIGITDHRTFLCRGDFEDAFRCRPGLNKALLKQCRAAQISTAGLLDREDILKALRTHAKKEERESCPICMECYQTGDSVCTLLCSTEETFHAFHTRCIGEWAQSEYRSTGRMPRCPTCRESLRHTEGVMHRL